MKPLEDLSLGYRIVLTAVIVIVILLLLAAFGWWTGRWDEAGAAPEEPIDRDEAHMLALDREALDQAYKDHIKLVFGVWMKAPTDSDSPRRAGAGAHNARQGYRISRDKIEQRERQLKEFKQ
jgi:hypothetical protein